RGQRGRAAARPADVAGAAAGVHEAPGAGAGACDQLLPTSVDAIRRPGGIALSLFHAGVIAFCRYTTSEMLFRQIVGRALRLHVPEDGTAAQIYVPAFPVLLDFAESLYTE